MKFTLVVALLLTASAAQGQKSKWTYEGVAKWKDTHEEFCNGFAQSPVDIQLDKTKFSGFQPFNFMNYDEVPKKQTVVNTGTTVRLTYEADPKKVPTLQYGGLWDDYVLKYCQFHWGSDDVSGSEHTIDSVKYPMEMQCVHYKKNAKTYEKALTKDDGLVIISLLFQLSKYDNPSLTPIVNDVKKVQKAGQSAAAQAAYAFAALLPFDRDSWYRYQGSLTTPMCNEIVTWTVFKSTRGVSRTQLETLRKLKTGDGKPMTNNFRPTQPIGKRTIYRSFK